jgi:hypothetical protein
MGKYEGIKTKFLTPAGRLMFEQLFKAKAFAGADPKDAKFSGTLILPKGDPKVEAFIAELKESIKAVIKAEWPAGGVKPEISCLKDGDTSKFTKGKNKDKLRKEVNPEVAGHWIISATRREDSEYPHAVRDNNLNDITNPALVYSGCRGKLEFSIFAYSKSDLGVAGGLDGFQKLGDDKPFARSGGSLMEKEAPVTSAAPNSLPVADDYDSMLS